jgi:hypothetical protein
VGPPALAIEARRRDAVSGRTKEEMTMATTTRSTVDAERMSLVDTAWLHMEMPTNLMMRALVRLGRSSGGREDDGE